VASSLVCAVQMYNLNSFLFYKSTGSPKSSPHVLIGHSDVGMAGSLARRLNEV